MALSLAATWRAVADALEGAHSREDVETYVGLFGTGTTTGGTSRGVLFDDRDDLRNYLGGVMPRGLAGGSVSYRAARTTAAGGVVVVVINQEYRSADGERMMASCPIGRMGMLAGNAFLPKNLDQLLAANAR